MVSGRRAAAGLQQHLPTGETEGRAPPRPPTPIPAPPSPQLLPRRHSWPLRHPVPPALSSCPTGLPPSPRSAVGCALLCPPPSPLSPIPPGGSVPHPASNTAVPFEKVQRAENAECPTIWAVKAAGPRGGDTSGHRATPPCAPQLCTKLPGTEEDSSADVPTHPEDGGSSKVRGSCTKQGLEEGSQ